MYESEENFLGFVLGAALLSTAIFLLAAVGLAYRAVFFAVGIGVILLAVRYKAHRRSADRLPSLPGVWAWAFFAVYAAFSILYLSNALAPETSPDGVQYHLGFPVRYLDQHRLVPVTTDMYASLSAGIEMLFLFAFAFGKHSAAAMVHLLFLLVLPFGMLSYGKRIGMPAGWRSWRAAVFPEPSGRPGRDRRLRRRRHRLHLLRAFLCTPDLERATPNSLPGGRGPAGRLCLCCQVHGGLGASLRIGVCRDLPCAQEGDLVAAGAGPGLLRHAHDCAVDGQERHRCPESVRAVSQQVLPQPVLPHFGGSGLPPYLCGPTTTSS